MRDEEERLLQESREPGGKGVGSGRGLPGAVPRTGPARRRHGPWVPELAAAAVLAACAACLPAVPAATSLSEASRSLAERTLILGRMVGAGFSRAALGFSKYRAPDGPRAQRIPGYFRGKE